MKAASSSQQNAQKPLPAAVAVVQADPAGPLPAPPADSASPAHCLLGGPPDPLGFPQRPCSTPLLAVAACSPPPMHSDTTIDPQECTALCMATDKAQCCAEWTTHEAMRVQQPELRRRHSSTNGWHKQQTPCACCSPQKTRIL